jgi:glutamate carboxypeptidase
VDAPSHTYAREDVEAAASIVDAAMDALGARVTRIADPGGRFADHRVFELPAVAPDGHATALVGHIDTVFPRSMEFLEWRRDDGESESGGDVVRGPGVLDMKSGLSAIIFALGAIRDVAPDTFAALACRFVLNSDEEVGSPSSSALFDALAPKTTAALVFEAGRLKDEVVVARKGGGTFTLEVRGRAAHAGNAHAEGINAIHALALLIPRVEALTDYARGVTVNVGLIEGGTAKNTVPEHAKAVIDARFVRGEDARAVEQALRALVAEPFAGLDVPERWRDATVTLGGGVTRPPMEATPESVALCELYSEYARDAGLAGGPAPLQGGGSDANLLSAHGVPCIDGLGPFGRHFHRVEEWSSLTSLQRRTEALAAFLVDGLPRLEGQLGNGTSADG